MYQKNTMNKIKRQITSTQKKKITYIAQFHYSILLCKELLKSTRKDQNLNRKWAKCVSKQVIKGEEQRINVQVCQQHFVSPVTKQQIWT